jgi:hypothetical protein
MQKNYNKQLVELGQTGNLQNTEFDLFALKNQKRIGDIPYHEQTAEMAFIAVNRGTHFLAYVVLELKIIELYLLAIEKIVSDASKILELCFLAVSKNPLTLRYVPTELRNLELCKITFLQSKNYQRIDDYDVM